MNYSAPKPDRKTRAEYPKDPDFRIRKVIEPVTTAAYKLESRTGRFEIYEYLSAVYRMYRRWKRRKIAHRTARLLAYRLNICRRRGVSPIRILIEATFPSADSKQKSRWVRALQYASSEDASADELRSFFRSSRGVAGCAHLAAKHQPKKNRHRNAWVDQERGSISAANGVHDSVNLAGKPATRGYVLLYSTRYRLRAGHAHDGGIDHPHRRVISGGQRIHDAVPEPAVNERRDYSKWYGDHSPVGRARKYLRQDPKIQFRTRRSATPDRFIASRGCNHLPSRVGVLSHPR